MRWKLALPWMAVAVVVAAIIAGAAVWKLKPPPLPEPKQVMRFDYELPEGLQFNRDTDGAVQYEFAISPDGSQFVYSTTEGLYLRAMNTQDARHIAGTDRDSVLPFFSPDGRWIGYLYRIQQKLMKVPVSGGAPEVLCEAGGLYTTPTFNFGKPEVLFKGTYVSNPSPHNYVFWDIGPDGKRFLMVKLPEESAPPISTPQPKITIVLNRFEELKEMVPVN